MKDSHHKYAIGSQNVHTLPLILLGWWSWSLMKQKLNEEILYYQMHADCLLDTVTDALESYCQFWPNEEY